MKKSLVTVLLLFVASLAWSQPGLRKMQYNIDKNAVAAGGYDVVSYFTQNKAVKGDKNFAVSAEGLLYYFSSQPNKELFLANWKKYEPQYGGWCAYAMGASGEKVEVDPATFKITDGKLYLFYNKFFTNTLKSWNKDEARLMKNADANWMKFYH